MISSSWARSSRLLRRTSQTNHSHAPSSVVTISASCPCWRITQGSLGCDFTGAFRLDGESTGNQPLRQGWDTNVRVSNGGRGSGIGDRSFLFPAPVLRPPTPRILTQRPVLAGREYRIG